MPVIYDIDRRVCILEDLIQQATDRHERHFYEERLIYLENLKRK